MATCFASDIRSDIKKLKAQEDKLAKLKNAAVDLNWLIYYKVR